MSSVEIFSHLVVLQGFTKPESKPVPHSHTGCEQVEPAGPLAPVLHTEDDDVASRNIDGDNDWAGVWGRGWVW